MRKTLVGALMGLALTASSSAFGASGAELYKAKTCHTCHGEAGNKPTIPQYPKIGGQSEIYLVQQMKDIKSGKRNNAMSAVMKGIMMTVSDAEMASIAKYLAAVK